MHEESTKGRAGRRIIAPGVAAVALASLAAAVPSVASVGPPARPSAELLSAGRVVASDHVLVAYRGQGSPAPERVRVPAGTDLRTALAELRSDPAVRWADPDPIATISAIVPNDRGRGSRPGAWQRDQWNFLPPPPTGVQCTEARPCGVNAPDAWQLLRDAGHPEGRATNGQRGPIVAVIDTGVAYRDLGKRFRKSPELARGTFVAGRDFRDDDRRPLDENGHGTHVASTIAQRTGNGRSMTGLGDGLRIMPVRVLNRDGSGTASDVANGLRFAVREGADVINLSLEFSPSFTDCTGLRVVCRAINAAERQGVLVVGTAGNRGLNRAQMPGREAFAVASGTIRGCLSRFSSRGAGVGITAPGGGVDSLSAGLQCASPARGPGIVQLTLRKRGGFRKFGYPRYEGTSMAAPHVSAAAALVLSSGVLADKLGRRPRPADLTRWLGCTARAPFDPTKASLYGAGLLDLAAAVDPASPCPGLTP